MADPDRADSGGNRKKTYVLYTLSGKEHQVLEALRHFLLLPGEDAYTPLLVKKKRIHGEDREVMANLFPGYLFIETDDPVSLYNRGKALQGEVFFQYLRLLRNDAYIVPISDGEERMLHELCDEHHICDFSRGYIEGDRVVITEGPLKNFSGRILHIDRHKKTARITTYLINRKMNVTVGLEIVSKSTTGHREENLEKKKT